MKDKGGTVFFTCCTHTEQAVLVLQWPVGVYTIIVTAVQLKNNLQVVQRSRGGRASEGTL